MCGKRFVSTKMNGKKCHLSSYTRSYPHYPQKMGIKERTFVLGSCHKSTEFYKRMKLQVDILIVKILENMGLFAYRTDEIVR